MTRFKYPVLIVILCYLSRIPFLTGPNLFLDGDECITALMARMLMEGRDCSLFFWGQDYGLAIFEVLAIIPFYLFLGYTTLAVKLGALSLWTLGTVFLYKSFTIAPKGNNIVSFLLTCLFIVFPSWIVFSTKAWAGTVTAFTVSSLLFYIIIGSTVSSSYAGNILIGILTALVFEAQRMWLAGILPVLLYKVIKDRSYTMASGGLIAFLSCYLGFYLYKQHIIVTRYAPISLPKQEHLHMLATRFPDYLLHSLEGNYYFNNYYGTSRSSHILALLLTISFFIVFIVGLYQLFFAKKKNYLFAFASGFTVLCYAYNFLSYTAEGRYLLPVTSFTLLSLSLLAGDYSRKKIFVPVLLTLTGIGIVSAFSFHNYAERSKDYKRSVLGTISYCKSHHINYTFCTECMLPWQIVFYSDMKIYSRMPFQPARYQPISDSVDAAYKKGLKTALLIYCNDTAGITVNICKNIGELSISENPPVNELRKRFDLK